MEAREKDGGRITQEGKAKVWTLVFILKAMVKDGVTGVLEQQED